jgi:hypothetical protein
MIRDRISYTIQNLQIANYEHQMVHILKFSEFCTREDVFQVLMMIYTAETEEDYLNHLKRFVSFTKLIAPEIIELYELSEKMDIFTHLCKYIYMIQSSIFSMFALSELNL